MSLRIFVEGLLPFSVMDPIRTRRAKAQAEQWKRDAAADRAALHAKTWQEACQRTGTYQDELLNRFRVERSAAYVPDGKLLTGNILSPVIAMLGNTRVAVTDFGGGTGDLGYDAIKSYPNVAYTVVEQPTLVEMMLSKNPSLIFVTDAPAQCDIFYASGVLQYLDDPMTVLARGFASARHAVILRRTHFSDIERFDVQKSRLFDNGSGPVPAGIVDREIAYPRRTMVESEIISVAKANNFECRYCVAEDGANLDGIYGVELVFSRQVT